jgi:hypothetical protein
MCVTTNWIYVEYSVKQRGESYYYHLNYHQRVQNYVDLAVYQILSFGEKNCVMKKEESKRPIYKKENSI